MAQGFLRDRDQVVAFLDDQERRFITSLLDQTHQLLAQSVDASPVDEFEALMLDAGLLDVANGGRPEGGSGASGTQDPAVARLLPTGNREDEQVAAEFRRLTMSGLRERKSAQLAVAADVLRSATSDRVSMSPEQAQSMLVALTDVRLVLAERLGIRTDEDAEALHERIDRMSEADEGLGLSIAYDFLTWLQETLVSALSR